MHNVMQYEPIQGQTHEHFKVKNQAIFKSYLLCHSEWELATDHGFLNEGTISKFDLVFVSRDFEVGRNVSCEESTMSPIQGYFFFFVEPWAENNDSLNLWHLHLFYYCCYMVFCSNTVP